MAEQAVQRAMAEHAVQGAMAEQEQIFLGKIQRSLAGTGSELGSEVLPGLHSGTEVLSGLHSGSEALPGPDMGTTALPWGELERHGVFQWGLDEEGSQFP